MQNTQNAYKIPPTDIAITIGDQIILKDCFNPGMGTVIYNQRDFVMLEDGLLTYYKKFEAYIPTIKNQNRIESTATHNVLIDDERPRIQVDVRVDQFCKIISPLIGKLHNKEYFNNSLEEIANVIFENFSFKSQPSLQEIFDFLLPIGEAKNQIFKEPNNAISKLCWVGQQNSLYCLFMLLYGNDSPRSIKVISGCRKNIAHVISNITTFRNKEQPVFDSIYNYMRKSKSPEKYMSPDKVKNIRSQIKTALQQN